MTPTSNKLVRAANGTDHAYRDTGEAAGDGVPLVLLQQAGHEARNA
jgi:hypothetical protein